MTYFTLLKRLESQLLGVCGQEALSEASYLLREVFCLGKVGLLSLYHETIDDKTSILQVDRLVQRRLKGEPLAYVLGHQEFCGRRYGCPQGVLIPRPETEVFVEVISEYLRSREVTGLCLLECGAGTGCISIELALRFPGIQVMSWDINPLAIKTARENAKYLGATGVTFVHGNFFDVDFSAGDVSEIICDKDVVLLSNPPYVSEDEWQEVSASIRSYEPKEAFLSGQLGLDHLLPLIDLSIKFSWPSFFEIGFKHANMLRTRLDLDVDLCFFKDLEGIERVLRLGI
ncbi:MAG: HemK/PrmC family methyltransferase [bacterium]